MHVLLNTSTMTLEDEPLDIGYSSEEVTLTDAQGNEKTLGGQNGKTQLIITAPFIDDTFVEELKVIEEALPTGGEYEVTASIIVANDTHTDPKLEKFEFLIDSKGEFGDWYGVRLVGEPCGGELTKAAILISKDGALFYDDYPNNLHETFNQETLQRKILAAQTCYTGKGCH